MMARDNRGEIADLAVLFELSLAIGTSLDLRTNCERFLHAVMSRKNLAWAGVWVSRAALPEREDDPSTHTEPSDRRDELVLVYGSSRAPIHPHVLVRDHPLLTPLATSPHYRLEGDSPWLDEVRVGAAGHRGSYGLFRLGDFGVLMLWSLANAQAFEGPALRQLDTVVRKFAVSIEGCIAHDEAVREIAERERAQAALAESEERFRTLVEHAPEGILVVEADTGRIVDTNPNALRLLGTTREQLLSAGLEALTALRVGSRELSLPFAERVQAAAKGTPCTFECDLCFRDGKPASAEVRLVQLPWRDHSLVRVSLLDITERHELEEQLRHVQKMDAVGQLAGGVAHDFNNLLGVIMGLAELLARAEPGSSNWREMVDEVLGASRRAASLTKQLLAFSRRTSFAMGHVELHGCIDEAVSLLEYTLDRRIRIERQYAAHDTTVLGDATQLQQLFINLAVNARDAMPAGGTLRFRTCNVHLGESAPEARHGAHGLRPGSYVLLEVCDTGKGMDEATQQRIFEPFFTTKEVGQGTGLGLAVGYGTVRAHGGDIQVQSTPGGGTCFTLRLPTRTPAQNDDQEPSRRRPPKGRGLVLVADDEHAVRMTARAQLEELGYEVVTAADGSEAIECLRQSRRPIDVVILDVMMPCLDGAATLRTLRVLRPDVPVIVASGFGHPATIDEIRALGVDGFLAKPFELYELADRVERVLRARREALRTPIPTPAIETERH